MRMKFGVALVALLVGSSAAMSAELYIPTKGGTKVGKPATNVRSVEKSHRHQQGAANCTFKPLCARVATR